MTRAGVRSGRLQRASYNRSEIAYAILASNRSNGSSLENTAQKACRRGGVATAVAADALNDAKY